MVVLIYPWKQGLLEDCHKRKGTYEVPPAGLRPMLGRNTRTAANRAYVRRIQPWKRTIVAGLGAWIARPESTLSIPAVAAESRTVPPTQAYKAISRGGSLSRLCNPDLGLSLVGIFRLVMHCHLR